MITDEKKIKEKLLQIGMKIESIYDLVNSKEKYPEAIESLISLIEESSEFHPNLTEGIVRSLAVKEAKGRANTSLFNLYDRTDNANSLLKWAIGNTINVIVQTKDENQIIKIVSNKSNGISRQMFVLALGKIKSESVENVLINLLDDEEVSPYAINSLGQLKSKKAKTKINDLLNHKKPLIRKEAQKFLKKMEKSQN